MQTVAVCRKAGSRIKPRFAARDNPENPTGQQAAQNLRDDVGSKLPAGEAASRPQPNGHSRVQVTPRNMANRIGHGQHGKTESKRDTEQPDADSRKSRGKHRAAAT